jgi:hypothetical protein
VVCDEARSEDGFLDPASQTHLEWIAGESRFERKK